MLFVLIILSGILWVIFSQLDQSYETPILFHDIQKEHNEFIQKIYQLQPTEPVVISKPVSISPNLSETQNKATGNIEQNRYLAPETLHPNSPSYEPSYSLQNNPWSPGYKPGY